MIILDTTDLRSDFKCKENRQYDEHNHIKLKSARAYT